MPRRKKVELSVPEKIEAIKAEIAEAKELIRVKQKELKALEEELDRAEKDRLYAAYKKSGKSIEEAEARLSQ